MKRAVGRVVALVSLVMAPVPAWAQLLADRDALVVYGHHHLNVTDVAAHTTFFAGTLGGVPITMAGEQIVKFPNVLVFLRRQPPRGGTKGSSVDHIGFSVPNLRAVLDRVRANGYRIVTSAEAPPGWRVKDGIGTQAGRAAAFVMGPDELLVELVEVRAQKVPTALHHVHFAGPQNTDMQTWYGTVFRAKAGPAGARTPSLSLPGVELDFSRTRGEVAGTKGRVIDHIGFEIDRLDSFLVRIEDMGVEPTVMQRLPALGMSTAFINDPWGTSIQLTEGLDDIK